MSLINDALKKAQKQRTGEAPSLISMPGVGGESPQRIARRARPAGFDTLVMRAGIGMAVVLVLAVGGYFAFRGKSEDKGQKTAVSANQSSSPVAKPLDEPAVALVKAGGPATPAVPTFTLPVAPKTESVATKSEPPTVVAKTTPPAVVSPPASAPAPSSVVHSPSPAALTPAAERPKLDPRAIEFIENIKVAVRRASATDPKVLMNDRVYRPGSQISAEFGLKLVEITADSLTFEDDRGGRYTRIF